MQNDLYETVAMLMALSDKLEADRAKLSCDKRGPKQNLRRAVMYIDSAIRELRGLRI